MAQNVEWDSDTSRVFPVACMLGNLESPSHWRLSLAFRSALYSDVNGQHMSPPLGSPSLYPCSWLHVNLCFCTQSPSCPLTLLIYWSCRGSGRRDFIPSTPRDRGESVEGLNKWSWTDLSQKPTSKHTLYDGHCSHILTHFIFATPPWSRCYYPI